MMIVSIGRWNGFIFAKAKVAAAAAATTAIAARRDATDQE
jgi:hypothetical protein